MKNDDGRCLYGAAIERGKVTAVNAGGITVESWDRPGVRAAGLGKVIAAETITAGDNVYFFLFEDGKGFVIRKM